MEYRAVAYTLALVSEWLHLWFIAFTPKLIVKVFCRFTSNPFPVQKCSSTRSCFCNPAFLVEIKTISSAKSKHVSVV